MLRHLCIIWRLIDKSTPTYVFASVKLGFSAWVFFGNRASLSIFPFFFLPPPNHPMTLLSSIHLPSHNHFSNSSLNNSISIFLLLFRSAISTRILLSSSIVFCRALFTSDSCSVFRGISLAFSIRFAFFGIVTSVCILVTSPSLQHGRLHESVGLTIGFGTSGWVDKLPR